MTVIIRVTPVSCLSVRRVVQGVGFGRSCIGPRSRLMACVGTRRGRGGAAPVLGVGSCDVVVVILRRPRRACFTLSPQVVGFPAPLMPSSLSLRPVLCGSAFWLMSCGVGASSVVAPVMSGEWVFRRAKTCRVFDGSHGAFSAPCLGSTSPCDFLARSARAARELCRQVSRGCLVCCCGQTKCCADRPNARADGFAMKFAGGCPRVGGCSCRR